MTLIIFKKDMTGREWPQLSKTSLSYVKRDFSQCHWDEDGSTDIVDVDMDGSPTGTKGRGISKQVFFLWIKH
jgi:hypothetical protein